MLKDLIKLATFSALLFNSIATFAITPRNDWYAGIFLGPSATNGNSFDFGQPVGFSNSNVSFSATSGNITYSVLGGIGGQIGYRFCNRHRIEGEFYYNNNPIQKLQLYNYSVSNTYYPDANETVSVKEFNNLDNTSDAHIQGDTNTGAFMINFIFDMLTPNANNDGYNKVAPFVGVGVGYAYVQNAMQFIRATTVDPADDPYQNREIFQVLQQKYIYAGQLMMGINYFMDDFTWFGIDVRYFMTGSANARSRYTYTGLEESVVVSSNSNLFSKNTQILSANLSFNGTLNFL